jgi:hypothetical protein
MTESGNQEQPGTAGEGHDERAQHFIDQVSIAARLTIFTVTPAKGSCNQIVFEFGENQDLKSLMLGLFEAGKPFDFHITAGVPNNPNQCKIDRIMRAYGRED